MLGNFANFSVNFRIIFVFSKSIYFQKYIFNYHFQSINKFSKKYFYFLIFFFFFCSNSSHLLQSKTTDVLLLFYIFRLYLLLLQRAYYIDICVSDRLLDSFIATAYCDCQTLTDLLTTTCCRSYCHEYTNIRIY